MIDYVPTICPYCGCGCGKYLVVKGGEIIGVEPWKEHPVNEGKNCPKGRNAKKQIEIENLILLGMNCTDTLLPAVAKKMLIEEYEVNPDDVIREDIDDGKLIITLSDGGEKERNDVNLLIQKSGNRME